MKKILVYGLIIFLLTGCLAEQIASSLINNSPEKVYQKIEDITFIDTDSFDEELSGSMLAHTKAVTVTMIAPASINEIPRRLNKWLSAITEQKGRVYIEPKTTNTSSSWAVDLL